MLKRSQRVGSFKGRWAGVSGYVEGSPYAQSLIEIGEETGLSPAEVTLVKKGEQLAVDDSETKVRWIIHPYLYHTGLQNQIKTDWEHSEYCWIKPGEMDKYDTVPMLKEAFQCVCTP